jgi:hypothetical protein
MKLPAHLLSSIKDDDLPGLAKIAQDEADKHQRLAASHQRLADAYRKEQRRRQRAAKDAAR